MLSETVIERLLDEAMTGGADFAEVFDEDTFRQEAEVTGEGVEAFEAGRESGVGLRLFKDQNCYYMSLSDRDESSLMVMAKTLTKAMKAGSERTGRSALEPVRSFGMEEGTVRPGDLDADKRLEPARICVKAGMAHDPEIVRMKVRLTDYDQEVQIANSDGLFVRDERVKTRLYIQAYASDGKDMQVGYYGPGAMRGHDFYGQLDIEAAACEAARQAKVILHAAPMTGGPMSVVVGNGFGGLLFHEACGHSLEATVTARDSSEFAGKIGQMVASPCVTLIDDGSIRGEWGSLHVDDEGVPTRKNILIENGILKGYMVDRLNGLRIDLPPTGSCRRQNYRFIPVARMTNTYIAPGETTPGSIIRDTESGLYVASINGGSVDPATGDFNFSAGECYRIRGGQIAEPVRGITLIGNGRTVLENVDRVGNDFRLGQGFCFASSGALFIGAGQPTVRISKMTVGGIG